MNPIKSLIKTIRDLTNAKAKAIDIKLKLDNAIELQNLKHSEMLENYKNLLIRIAKLELKIKEMKKKSELASTNMRAEGKEEIAKVYNDSADKLISAKRKLEDVSKTMHKHIKNHGVKIEVLKAKKAYLDAVKTVNGYLEEYSSSGMSNDNINAIIDEAVAEAEAVNTALENLEGVA